MFTPHALDHSPRLVFPSRSRLAMARDLAIIALCLAFLAGFLADVWSASPARRVGPAAATEHVAVR